MATLVSALKEAYTYYIKQRFQGHSMFIAVVCGFCFIASIPYLIQVVIIFTNEFLPNQCMFVDMFLPLGGRCIYSAT